MNIKDILPSLFLFKGLKTSTIDAISSKLDFKTQLFDKGEIIFSPECYEKKIGFVIKGECVVQRVVANGEIVHLNTVKPYDSFGIVAVLGKGSEYPTTVISKKKSTILFIDSENLKTLIKKHPVIAMNTITFLSEKISFLNEKIATFSGKSVEQKLANYLISEAKKCGDIVHLSATKISESISVGRASIYRTLSDFESFGVITLSDKKIIINSKEELERILK